MKHDLAALLYYPRDDRYYVELDPAQVFPDDPGQGTPVVVYCVERGKLLAGATYNCAVNEGELTNFDRGAGSRVLPEHVLRWLTEDPSLLLAIDCTYELGEREWRAQQKEKEAENATDV